MFSHIPSTLTIAGRVTDAHGAIHWGSDRTTVINGVNLHVKTHREPYSFRALAFAAWCGDGHALDDNVAETEYNIDSPDDDKGRPHPFPEAMYKARLVTISSCPNALFIAPDSLGVPCDLALIVHCRCTLANHSVLGHKYDLLSAWIKMSPDAEPAMLPCYYINQFRVAMPPLDMLFAPFVFTENSNLDAFAIVHTSANPNRNTTHSSSSSTTRGEKMAATAPVLPAWMASWSHGPYTRESHFCDGAITGPLLLNTIPSLESSPPIDKSTIPTDCLPGTLDHHELLDVIDSLGLDGRFVAQAGLRGPDAKRVLASHALGELLRLVVDHYSMSFSRVRQGISTHHLLMVPILSIMYWILAHRAANHPLCVKDEKLRAVMHSLAGRFFSDAADATFTDAINRDAHADYWTNRGQIAAMRRTMLVWNDFLTKCSVSRFMYTWLERQACDVATLECQQVLVDTFMDVLREMLPETREALHRALVFQVYCMDTVGDEEDEEFEEPAPFDFDMFVNDERFGFHRSALKLYTERLIDRTRHRMTPKERMTKTDAIEINLRARIEQVQRGETEEVDFPDPEDLAAEENAANSGGDGDAEPVHDASYYARRGAHGNGHLYLKGVATDAPFGDGSGRMWKWSSVDNNKDGHSPIVIDEDPNGRKGLDLRVTAYSDYKAMTALKDYLIGMGSSFYQNREWLHDLIETNRKKVFTGESRITLSDGSVLDLSAEQMALFDRICDDPGLLIAGGAGTGKSTLIAALLTVFNGSAKRPAEQVKSQRDEGNEDGSDNDDDDDEDADNKQNATRSGKRLNPLIEWLQESPVVLLMAYGKVASNFTRAYGMFASTVHFAGAILNGDFHHDDRAWEPPHYSASKALIAIVDEITVQSLTHMTMLRNAFPRLMKLIVVGDIQQMSCIDRGAVGDAMVRIIDEYPRMKVQLTHNYRLTNQSSDDLQLEARTHRAFDAINRGSVLDTPGVYGPYSDSGRGADLPAICELSSWDPALVKRALTRAPVLLLPHLNLNQGALASLRSTCDALIKVIGNKSSEWDGVQVLSQRRREEVGPITAHISGALYKDLPKTPQGYLPVSDLCVGEKAVFKRRVPALSPNGRSCFIYTNDMRTIAAIEDADETILNPRDYKKRQVVFRNQVKRKSTREYVKMGNFHPRRVRVITFTDGYRVVVPYPNPMGYKNIDFLRRGLCVTNASMQGSAADTIVTYIRPEVSHTLDRRQFYTSVSRMRSRAIIIGSRETLEKVVRQQPQARNDHLHEFLREAFAAWEDMSRRAGALGECYVRSL